ncbi:hypothetical protein ACIA49_33155 [Kribbella sp. NPDC051587]|uniref:hypothetical protein n=1 Tax=Kribbella sp. NPDC051587 TaxID=3364119 RepID=UPI0037BAEA76
MEDQGFAVSEKERQRLLAVNMAAARFFRRELLRANSGWPLEYLRARGAESVLTINTDWKVGYAPNSWTRLADHLCGEGISHATMVKAGLVEWAASGEAVDRHRDKLMLVARDHLLSPVGFVGISEDGHASSVTPVSAIHRPSNVVVGVEEQRDLFVRGAVPVIVEHPIDAIAVTNLSRANGGLWVGIPVGEDGLSTAQARIVRRHSRTDKVIVVMSGDSVARRRAAGCVVDLAFFFDRVRVVELTTGFAEVLMREGASDALHELLSGSRSLITYKLNGSDRGPLQVEDLDPPDRRPGLA